MLARTTRLLDSLLVSSDKGVEDQDTTDGPRATVRETGESHRQSGGSPALHGATGDAESPSDLLRGDVEVRFEGLGAES
jgi:hypothetical protein